MMCLSCAITYRVKLNQDTLRLGTCPKCNECRVIGEVKK